jgi:hypothetical protein
VGQVIKYFILFPLQDGRTVDHFPNMHLTFFIFMEHFMLIGDRSSSQREHPKFNSLVRTCRKHENIEALAKVLAESSEGRQRLVAFLSSVMSFHKKTVICHQYQWCQ